MSTQPPDSTLVEPSSPEIASLIDPRRLALLHLDTLQQLLLTPADAEGHGELREQLARLERIAEDSELALPLEALRIRHGLSPLEVELLVLGSMHQLRADMAGRGLSVAEALTMQLDDPVERLEALSRLREEAPLRRLRLLELYHKDPAAPESDLMRRELAVPERVQAYLVGERTLGESLGAVARFAPDAPYPSGPSEVLPEELALGQLIANWRARDGIRTLAVALIGGAGAGKSMLARTLAQSHAVTLIEVDAMQLAALGARQAAQALESLFAAAQLYDAWLAFDRIDVLEARLPHTRTLADHLDGVGPVVMLLSPQRLSVSHPLSARVLQHLELGVPPEVNRRSLWTLHLDAERVATPAESDLTLLSGNFELSPAQIRNAARAAALRGEDLESVAPTFAQLEGRAFEQMRGDLSELATVRKCTASFEDLVLPPAEKEMIGEIVRAARYRTELLHGWRFKQRYSYGTGIVCLFSGDPGTGKTYCAEIIGATLGLELYQIAVPQVVSKWVGETEKQIARIFHEARAARALLLFDEADSLFGSRTEVRTASDRYANMATNFLLQAIEAHEGVVILTTNLEENLDAAAERRILFRMRFPFPDATTRAELWRRMVPPGAPVDPDVDYAELGEHFELSGGHIKNAIIRAAYDALERRAALDMETLFAAAEREARMIGRLVRRWQE